MTLGDIVKNYRESHGYSMETFASLCGLSKGYISILESNKSPRTKKPLSPSLDTFNRIASAMGLSLDQLMEMCDENQSVSLAEPSVSVFDENTQRLISFTRNMTEDEKRQLLLAARLIVAQRSEK